MSRRILVPMDGSPKSIEGLEYALSTFPAEEITVIYVMTPFDTWNSKVGRPSRDSVEDWYDEAHTEAERVLDEARELATEHGVDISTATDIGEPWRTIVTYTEEHDVDHVIMGSHGRTDDSSLALGSVAETVMRRSPVLVSIVR